MPKPRFTLLLEASLFASRWILAPFYIGLAIALVALLAVFVWDLPREIIEIVHTEPVRRPEAGILMVLSLIDLSLAGDLLVIVILSGYENFVSRIQTADVEARPSWMGTIDFSGLKMKLISSIVAIASIALLRTYLEIGEQPRPDETSLKWQMVLTLGFVIVGVLLALMDWIVGKTQQH